MIEEKYHRGQKKWHQEDYVTFLGLRYPICKRDYIYDSNYMRISEWKW